MKKTLKTAYFAIICLTILYINGIAADQQPPPKQLRLPLTRVRGGRIFVTIKVDQILSVMLVDTGSAVSLMDGVTGEATADEASRLMRGTAGMTTATFTKMVEMDFGQTISATVAVRVLDLSIFRQGTMKNDGWPAISGALGADVLRAFGAVVDYENDVLILNIPGS